MPRYFLDVGCLHEDRSASTNRGHDVEQRGSSGSLVMKYVDEFRDRTVAVASAERIKKPVHRLWTIMEVCGGQTHAIVRFGLDSLLPQYLFETGPNRRRYEDQRFQDLQTCQQCCPLVLLGLSAVGGLCRHDL